MSLLLESGRNTMGFCGMVVSSPRKADSDMSEVLLPDTKTKHRIASVLLEDHIILDGKLTGNLWFDPGLIGLRINGTIPLQQNLIPTLTRLGSDTFLALLYPNTQHPYQQRLNLISTRYWAVWSTKTLKTPECTEGLDQIQSDLFRALNNRARMSRFWAVYSMFYFCCSSWRSDCWC